MVMKIERVLMIAAVMAMMACHGNDKAVRKDQQYDVVQEGQATGVTSTINAPGETPPVTTATLTGTGTDTTTAFNSTTTTADQTSTTSSATTDTTDPTTTTRQEI
jgi:hypothetical protein